MSSRMRIAGLGALVLGLFVAGALLWFGDVQTEFGWFAYAPLDPRSTPGILFITGRRLAALLMSLMGLALLSGVVGFIVGRRSQST